LISTSLFVPQQTGQIIRPSAGHERFSFRVWQSEQAIPQALHTATGWAMTEKLSAAV